MPREPEPSLNERTFVLESLLEERRVDRRGLFDQRDVVLDFGSGDGSNDESGWCECRLGDTRVAAQVSAEVVKPSPDRASEGFLMLATEISPMASAAYEAGRPSDEETAISRLLDKAIRRSGAVDREALCIVAGQKVWSIRVDLHFLSDCGNMVDAASIAAITALRNFRRPEVTVVGEEVTVHSLEERVPVPLAMHHFPICISFAFFGDKPISVLDPTLLEQQISSGTLTLTLNAQSEICVLTKAGGVPLAPDDVMKLVRIGGQRVSENEQVMKKALERQEQKRLRGQRVAIAAR